MGFFWEYAQGLSEEKKKALLSFITSSDRVPVGGCGALRIVISRHGTDVTRCVPLYLPAARMAHRQQTADRAEGAQCTRTGRQAGCGGLSLCPYYMFLCRSHRMRRHHICWILCPLPARVAERAPHGSLHREGVCSYTHCARMISQGSLAWAPTIHPHPHPPPPYCVSPTPGCPPRTPASTTFCCRYAPAPPRPASHELLERQPVFAQMALLFKVLQAEAVDWFDWELADVTAAAAIGHADADDAAPLGVAQLVDELQGFAVQVIAQA